MKLSRRGFLAGLGLAAPAVILTPGLLMPVRPLARPIPAFQGHISELRVIRAPQDLGARDFTIEFWVRPVKPFPGLVTGTWAVLVADQGVGGAKLYRDGEALPRGFDLGLRVDRDSVSFADAFRVTDIPRRPVFHYGSEDNLRWLPR